METREMILNTAFLGFLEEGFDAVSLNEIIKRTGLTKGAFYYYFKSKDELLKEIVDKYLHGYLRNYLKQMEQETGSFDEKINLIISTFSNIQKIMQECGEVKIDPKSFYLLLLGGLKRDENLRLHNRENAKRINEAFIKMINDGQEEGIIRKDFQPEELSGLLRVCLSGIMFDWVLNDSIDLNDSLKRNIKLIIDMIST